MLLAVFRRRRKAIAGLKQFSAKRNRQQEIYTLIKKDFQVKLTLFVTAFPVEKKLVDWQLKLLAGQITDI